MQAAKDCCPKEMQQGSVEKFLCKLLSIDNGKYFIMNILSDERLA